MAAPYALERPKRVDLAHSILERADVRSAFHVAGGAGLSMAALSKTGSACSDSPAKRLFHAEDALHHADADSQHPGGLHLADPLRGQGRGSASSTSASALGRPSTFPLARARASPAFTRS